MTSATTDPRLVEVGGEVIEYHLCRVLPDTALVLRDVLRESERLWRDHLGADNYTALRESAEGEAFFTGRVRLEPVPPEREMVAVWIPFPPRFRPLLRPQLVDYVEAVAPPRAPGDTGERAPPDEV